MSLQNKQPESKQLLAKYWATGKKFHAKTSSLAAIVARTRATVCIFRNESQQSRPKRPTLPANPNNRVIVR